MLHILSGIKGLGGYAFGALECKNCDDRCRIFLGATLSCDYISCLTSIFCIVDENEPCTTTCLLAEIRLHIFTFFKIHSVGTSCTDPSYFRGVINETYNFRVIPCLLVIL